MNISLQDFFTQIKNAAIGMTLLLAMPAIGQISSYPYSEDFGNTSCAMPSGYTNGGSDPWSFQNVTEQYMEGLDHTSNGGCFASMDDSGNQNDDSCLLTTPVFNLTSVPTALLRFWWQNSNSTTSLPDTAGPRPWSNLYVDISTDSGSTWTRDVWMVEDSQQIGWAEAFVPLDSFISTKTRIRFRGLETQTFRSDMSLDDILIHAPSNKDAAMASIASPTGGSCSDSAAIVSVKILNEGLDTITSLTVAYQLDSGTVVSETISVSIHPFANYTHTFTPKANISGVGNHFLKTWVDLALDSIYSNDTLVSNVQTLSTVKTFPYYENFENGQAEWVSSGSNNSWAFGTPSKSIIKGAASGSNAFVNGGLTGSYNSSEISQVSSPCFDFTNFNSKIFVEADIWWESESGYDGTVLQYSTDNGSNWTNVGSYGDPDNWYTSSSIDASPGGQKEGWDGTGTSGSGAWVKAKHLIPAGLKGVNNIIFRMAFAADGSVEEDGFAFDNFNIYEPAQWDAQVTEVLAPSDICSDSAVTVKTKIKNVGLDTIRSMLVSFQLNNGTIFTVTLVSLIIVPGFFYNHTFSAKANLSASGTFVLKAWSRLALDSAFSNDTASMSIKVSPYVRNFPYYEDFENGQNGWEMAGINSTWAFGTPNKSIISGAASGSNAFVNGGLTGTYDTLEVSEVVSPCFDFTPITSQLYIEADIWNETATVSDGVALQYTTNKGQSWNTIGLTNDPFNWYNYDLITAAPGGQTEGWTGTGANGTGGWVKAKHILPLAVVGAAELKFRFAFASDSGITTEGFAFDNVRLYVPDAWDASVVTLHSPSLVSCGDSAATVEIEVFNAGSDTITSTPVSFQINSGQIISDTLVGVISPNASLKHIFSQTANLNSVGNYTLKTWSNLPLDSIVENDSLTTLIVTSSTIDSFPYYENFENGKQGWEITGLNATWVLGTPAKATIIGASSGSNAFVTGGLTGSYNNNEISQVSSPCFDLPATSNELWVAIDVWWEVENTWDGAVLQYKTDSNTTWTNLGKRGDPYNWFNHSTIFSQPGGQGTGWTGSNNVSASGQWVKAKHVIPASLSGQSGLVFRMAFASDNIVVDDGIAFDNFAIVEYSKVKIDSHQTISCDTLPISLLARTTSWGQYSWNNQLGTDSLNIDTSGSYKVQFTDTILQLTSSATTAVNYFDPPKIHFASTLDSIQLSDSIVLNPGITGSYSYLWNPGNDTTATLNVRGIDYGIGQHQFTLNVTDTNTCEAMDTVYVVVSADPSTGIKHFDNLKLSLYPNPVEDQLIIEALLDQYTIEVYNNQGQLVLSGALKGQFNTLDVSSLEQGMYFLNIYVDNALVKIEKVLKK